MIEFNFTTLTPLHISNGGYLSAQLDYIIIDQKKLCKLNFMSLSKALLDDKVFDFQKNYDIDAVKKIIKDKLSDLYKKKNLNDEYFHYKIEITDEFKDYYYNRRNEGMQFVQEFINSNGKFYIPASTIKGAIVTALGKDKLGIDKNNPVIKDKVVFYDSKFIQDDSFCVYHTNDRPPYQNMICMKDGVSFKMVMKKSGNIKFDELKNSLKNYAGKQINIALNNIKQFKGRKERPNGADIFEEALTKINSISLNDDEYLMNLGYGGGSWFKIYEGNVPMFENRQRRSRKKGDLEPAHTSYTFSENPIHIGWCKVKIKET